MSDIRVKVEPQTISVRVGQQNATKVVSASNIANSLNDLRDVDTQNLNDKYVLMFNSTTGLYEFVNPDEVLSAAATEPIQPGLPCDFINALDTDLSRECNIDLDGGEF
jgi:hypothetical protein